MNLAIDIGNTRSKMGLFSEGKLHSDRSVDGLPLITNLKDVIQEHSVSSIGIASVGMDPSDLIAGLEGIVKVQLIEPLTPVPISSIYRSPQTLGIDRLCVAVAGHNRFPEDDVLVIDAGTCITYDLVDRHGTYQGGGIAPGIKMRLDAMHRFTARLPQVSPSPTLPPIGQDTHDSMRFGAQRGAVAEVNGLITHFKRTYPQLKVILTGGDRSTFEQHIENPIFAAPNLVLEGIDAILRHNEQQQ